MGLPGEVIALSDIFIFKLQSVVKRVADPSISL